MIVYVDIAFLDLSDVSAASAWYAALLPEWRRPECTISQFAALLSGDRVKVQDVAARES